MKNKQLALDELAKDCKVRGRYLTIYGHTCAIGRLAQLAGVNDETLLVAGGASLGSGLKEINHIIQAIQARFGLTRLQMLEIQLANDNYDIRTEELRSAAVLAVVRAIPEDPV